MSRSSHRVTTKLGELEQGSRGGSTLQCTDSPKVPAGAAACEGVKLTDADAAGGVERRELGWERAGGAEVGAGGADQHPGVDPFATAYTDIQQLTCLDTVERGTLDPHGESLGGARGLGGGVGTRRKVWLKVSSRGRHCTRMGTELICHPW